MTDISDLVTIFGGDSKVLAFYDSRNNVNGGTLATSWDDARGAAGYGPNWPAVGTTKPAYNTTTKDITLDAVNNGFESAVDAKFDPTGGKTVLYVGDFQGSTGWGPVLCDDPLTKYIGYDMRTAVMARASTGSIISMASARSSTRRAAMISTSAAAPYGGGGIEPHLVQVVSQVHGRPGRNGQYLLDNQNAHSAGSWRLNVGYFAGSVAQPAVIRAVIVLDHTITGAEWAAFVAWAVANHSAVADNANTRLVFFDGNSLMAGFLGSAGADPPAVVMAGGGLSTDCDYVQGGLNSVYGATMVNWSPSRVQPALKGAHVKKVYVHWEITNDIIGNGQTGAQAAENARLACVAAKAAGATTAIVCTCLPRGTFSGAQETQRLAANTAIRAKPTGIDLVCDLAAITNLQNTANATYFNADTTHLTDAGYSLAATDATNGMRQAILLAMIVSDHLTVTTQPSSPIASGAAHATQPVVAIKDAGGATVVADTSTVTAQLIVVTGSATPLGTLTKVAVAGVADFSANGLGATATYGATAKWRFTDGAITLADSSVFTVSPAPLGPFVVIAGITVPILEGQAAEQLEQGGSSERAYAGNLLSDCPWEKNAWQVTTGFLTRSEAAILRSAIAFRAHVVCSGVMEDRTVTCEVTWSNGAYINTSTADGSGILRSFVLLLREV
jgi:hypothetical protein